MGPETMKSQIQLIALILLFGLSLGCSVPWGSRTTAPKQSSLNQYLDRDAPQADRKTTASTKKPNDQRHPLVHSDVESEFVEKLKSRMKAHEAEAAPSSFASRVQALTISEEDKTRLLEEFSGASQAQQEELLSRLEPMFTRKSVETTETNDADLVSSYAEKLADRYIEKKPKTDHPQRLPRVEETAAQPIDRYSKSIDLNSKSVNPRASSPHEKSLKDTNIQLAAHVSDATTKDQGLYPETIQSASMRAYDRAHQLKSPEKSLKPATKLPEEDVSALSEQEFDVMQVLWDRGQVSLETLYKNVNGNSPITSPTDSPDPNKLSLDEIHTMLFDLKERGWVDDTRRGNTIAYWALRNRPESEDVDWDESLQQSIQQLEKVAASRRLSENERTIAQLRLRMLYLIANQKSDAMEKVEGLSTEEQEVWSNMLFGLADYMKLEEIPLDRRTSLALGSFRRAMSHLEKTSPLELRNLEFIQSVESFGQFKRFPVREFKPKQEVLLYVEVDNFTSHDRGGKFETTLVSNYEIYDQAGRRIDSRQFPEVKDVCGARRRDFYVPYRIYMPSSAEPGQYRLELTVRDPSTDKIGQASVEFKIR